MKIRFVKSLAIVVAMVAGNSAFGQGYYDGCDTEIETISYLGGGDSCQKDCDDDCGKDGKGCGKGGCDYGILDGLGCGVAGGGLWAEAELLFFKPDLEYGVGAGVTPPTFNHEAAPRIAVGYVGCGGLGVRFRYFDFSHDTGPLQQPGDWSLLVDTYTMDVELFEEVQIGCATTLEWSAGVRYNDFKGRDVFVESPTLVVGDQERFAGWGLVFGLKVDRCWGPGNFYGRARWAILEDENSTEDSFIGTPSNPMQSNFRTVYHDDKIMQTEIALGYEMSRCTNYGVVTGRIGYEIQFWEELIAIDGFDGLVLGVELAR